MSRFYKLKKNLSLRGWQKLSTGILDIENNSLQFIPKEYYSVLLLCNGRFDADGVFFSDRQRELLEKLEPFLDCFDDMQEPITESQEFYEYDNRFLKEIHWSITGRCNYRCRHCYMDGPSGAFGEITKEQAFRVVDQMAECGVFAVSLTGGEAMVHPNFWEIVDYLLEKRISVKTIYSNGFLINEKFAENLKKRNIKPSVSLSFDGLDGWHDWLRGVPNATEHIKNALRLCRENGLKVDAEMCLHKKNLHTLQESIEFLENEGVTSIKVNNLGLSGLGTELKDECLSFDEIFEICMDYLPKYIETNRKISVMLLGVLFITGGKIFIPYDKSSICGSLKDFMICRHSLNTLYLDPRGYATPCIPFSEYEEIETLFPNVFEKGLKSALSDRKFMEIINISMEEYFNHNPKCRDCRFNKNCAGGCRGFALSHSKDLFAVDANCCQFFNKGYYEKLKALVERFQKNPDSK